MILLHVSIVWNVVVMSCTVVRVSLMCCCIFCVHCPHNSYSSRVYRPCSHSESIFLLFYLFCFFFFFFFSSTSRSTVWIPKWITFFEFLINSEIDLNQDGNVRLRMDHQRIGNIADVLLDLKRMMGNAIREALLPVCTPGAIKAKAAELRDSNSSSSCCCLSFIVRFITHCIQTLVLSM